MRAIIISLAAVVLFALLKGLFVAFLLFAANAYPANHVLNTYTATECAVTKITSEQDSTRVFVNVVFSDVDGHVHKSEITTDESYARDLQVKDVVGCVYNPEDEDQVLIESWVVSERDAAREALMIYPVVFGAIPEVPLLALMVLFFACRTYSTQEQSTAAARGPAPTAHSTNANTDRYSSLPNTFSLPSFATSSDALALHGRSARLYGATPDGAVSSLDAGAEDELEALLMRAALENDAHGSVPPLLLPALRHALAQPFGSIPLLHSPPRRMSVSAHAGGDSDAEEGDGNGSGEGADSTALLSTLPAHGSGSGGSSHGLHDSRVQFVYSFRMSHPFEIGVGVTLVALLSVFQLLDLVYVVFFQVDVVPVLTTLLNAGFLLFLCYVQLLASLYLYYRHWSSWCTVAATFSRVLFIHATLRSVFFGFRAAVEQEPLSSTTVIEKYYSQRSGSGVRIGSLTVYTPQEDADRLHAKLRVLQRGVPLTDMSSTARDRIASFSAHSPY
eukprot:TRINITY_DN13494_c0_g1_i1.p1 TRINITY_DN13494_c0_g1~~TRINITY_DN13494_c0_g1_i1.p1  ORF type:complete len:503 (+),score=100.60 TRINITY_DN13494_c0_g1_i1:282-1790(+)